MKNENFKKVTFFNYLKFKIKWIFRVINCPFKKLESWM